MSFQRISNVARRYTLLVIVVLTDFSILFQNAPLVTSAFTSTAFRLLKVSSFVFSSSLQSQNSITVSQEQEPQRPPSPSPLVKRQYETFLWKPSTFIHFERDHHPTDITQFNINYRVEGPTDGEPILLVHGFGANVNHFRNNIPHLVEQGYRVYAIDLLGFGASDKPKNVIYSIELWADLLSDFIRHLSSSTISIHDSAILENDKKKKKKKWVIAGNSIGGLCSLATAVKEKDLIGGCILFNCAGAMTGFRYDELPIFLWPILWVIQNVFFGDFVGSFFFQNFKTRTNVERILKEQGVYVDQRHVNDELLEILLGPSDDEGAKDVFLRVFRGPPGPSPENLLQVMESPVLAIWGKQDPWTPHDGGLHPATELHKYAKGPFELVVLDSVGHCPHDETPDQVNALVSNFLRNLPIANDFNK